MRRQLASNIWTILLTILIMAGALTLLLRQINTEDDRLMYMYAYYGQEAETLDRLTEKVPSYYPWESRDGDIAYDEMAILPQSEFGTLPVSAVHLADGVYKTADDAWILQTEGGSVTAMVSESGMSADQAWKVARLRDELKAAMPEACKTIRSGQASGDTDNPVIRCIDDIEDMQLAAAGDLIYGGDGYVYARHGRVYILWVMEKVYLQVQLSPEDGTLVGFQKIKKG